MVSVSPMFPASVLRFRSRFRPAVGLVIFGSSMFLASALRFVSVSSVWIEPATALAPLRFALLLRPPLQKDNWRPVLKRLRRRRYDLSAFPALQGREWCYVRQCPRRRRPDSPDSPACGPTGRPREFCVLSAPSAFPASALRGFGVSDISAGSTAVLVVCWRRVLSAALG